MFLHVVIISVELCGAFCWALLLWDKCFLNLPQEECTMLFKHELIYSYTVAGTHCLLTEGSKEEVVILCMLAINT